MKDVAPWVILWTPLLWAPLLWAVAWKATVLLVVAWVVDRGWLRRRWLAADALWTGTLLGLAAMPLAAAVLARVTLPVWRAEAVPKRQAASDYVPSEQSSLATAAAHDVAAAATRGFSPKPALPTKMAPVESRSFHTSSWPAPAVAAVIAYLAVSVVMLGRTVFGLAATAHVVRRAKPMEDECWLTSLTARKAQLGLRVDVRLLVADAAASPFVTGWRRPAIVVSPDFAAVADNVMIDATLVHELTHVARNDFAIHLVGKFVEAIYWWNPLAWLATARLSSVREVICDGHCCMRMGSCERYGDVLLAIARTMTRQMRGVGLAMARGSRLRDRLGMLGAVSVAGHSLRRRTRIAWLLLPIAASALSHSVVVGYQAAPVASIREVIAALESVEKSIQGLSGELHLLAKYNFTEPGKNIAPNMIQDDAVSMTAEGDFLFDCRFDGTGRIDAEITRTSIRFDGTERARRLKMVSLFDGTQGKWIETQLAENGSELQTMARNATSFMKPNIDPLNLTTLHVNEAISKLLSERSAKVLKTELVDNRPTVVVEIAPKTVRDDYILQQRFWIDLERRVAVRRESMVQRGEGKPWGLHYRVHCQNYEVVQPGVWLPKLVRIWNYHVTTEGQGHLVGLDRIDVKTWKVNDSLAKIQIDDQGPGEIEGVATNDPKAAADSNETTPEAPAATQLKLKIVGESGEPIADAVVFQNQIVRPSGAPADNQQTSIKNQHYRTDAAGEALLTWEGESVDLRIWVIHPGHVPLFATWSREFQADGDQIPAEFQFVMKAGTKIGGVVQDKTGRPIAGAKVEISNVRAVPFAMTPARPTRAGRRPIPVLWLAEGDTALVTDNEGRWQATNSPSDEDLDVSTVAKEMKLPPDVPTHPLRLRVTHRDYETYDGPQDETLESAPSLTEMRSGDAVVVLKALPRVAP